MFDVLGKRAVWSVIVPSSNIVAEHDAWALQLPGIAFHFCPLAITNEYSSLSEMGDVMKYMRGDAVRDTARVALSANPDHVIMWCSSNTFWGGPEASRAFKQEFSELVGGRSVTMGAEAAAQALIAIGAHRVAVIAPYSQEFEPHIRHFFSDAGVDVVRVRCLNRATAKDIVDSPVADIIDELKELARPDIDTILQLGAGMSFLKLAAEAERWLNKPVISLSAAIVWSALRQNGMSPQISGFGSLLEGH